MRRATTPVHKFKFPTDPTAFEKILITYGQNGKKIFELNERDLTFEEYTVSAKLSQEETNMLDARFPVQIQLRGVTQGGNAVASKIFEVPIGEVLNDDIL